MRTLLLFVILILSHFHLEAKEEKRPTVCLNMIVKDESKVICRCLESVKPLIDYWLIVDTGSKDGTQKIIKDFMKDIPGELHERPWINFAHNRNEALNLAKNKADYLLFIDADDKLDIAKGFVRPKLDKGAYSLNIQYGNTTYKRPQLIKTSLNWKWEGVVHEALFCNEPYTLGDLDGVQMIIVGGGDRSADPKKFQKDAALLEKALETDPNNTRNVFYLAQSYRDAQMPEEALKNYQRRVDLGGWPEEVFFSLYQIAILQETLKMPEEVITKSYLKAWNYRPTRAEPLHRLASFYRQNENHLMSYLLSQFAMQIKQPNDVLFVESWMYDYGIVFENSISAYWVGHYEECYKLCNQLLSKKDLPPNIRECVARNLSFVIPKMPQKETSPLLKKAA